MEVSWSVMPHLVPDNYTNNIPIVFEVTRENPLNPDEPFVYTDDSLSIDIVHDTTATIPKPTKSGTAMPGWPTELGEAPADAEDYFYVRWSVGFQMSQYNTQPFRYFFEDTSLLPANNADYEFIGYKAFGRVNSNGTITSPTVRASYDEFLQNEAHSVLHVTQPETSGRNYGGTFYFRYPRRLLTEMTGGTGYDLRNRFTMRLESYDGITGTQLAEARLLYLEKNYSPPPGPSSLAKTGGIHAGAINLLHNKEQPLLLSRPDYNWTPPNGRTFGITSTALGYALTQDETGEYMQRTWRTQVTDNLMHIVTMEPENKLLPEDYDIHSVYIGYTDYELVPSILTQWTQQQKPIEKYIPLDLEYQDKAGEWHSYGTIRHTRRWSSWSYYTHSYNGVDREYYSRYRYAITLPDGAIGVRVTSQEDRNSISSRIDITMEMNVELNPTKRVLAAIRDEQGEPLEQQFIYNTADMKMWYQDGTPFELSPTDRWNTSFELTGYRPSSEIIKRIYEPKFENQVYTFPVRVQASEMVLRTGNIQDLKDYALPEHREMVFYDLLPLGADVDIGSVKVTINELNTSLHPTATPFLTNVQRIENWRDSGRVMIIAEATVPDNVSNYYTPSVGSDPYLRTGGNLIYNMIYPYQSVLDWGPRVNNQVAYQLVRNRDDRDNIALGKPDISIWPNRPAVHPYMSDLDGGGTNEEQRNFLYTEAAYNIPYSLNTSIGYMKSVRSLEEENFTIGGTEVAGGGEYIYRLQLRNYVGARTSGIVFYDNLELAQPTLEHWQGQLLSVDTSQPYMRGINPRVFYSTQNLRPRDNPAQQNLLDTAYWTEWTTGHEPNLASIRTIAIDMSKDRQGNDFVLGSVESLVVDLHMRAPVNPVPYLDPTIYAHNNAVYKGSALQSDGSPAVSMVEQGNTVTVSLRHTVDLDKSSDPATGTAEAPTVVYVDDEVLYRLDLRNTNTAETLTDVVLEDTIPVGLEVLPGIEVMVNDDTATRLPLAAYQERVTLTATGQHLAFSIRSMAPEEKLSFFIRAKVLSYVEPDQNLVFENTASVTKVYGQDYELDSPPTYHKTTKATVHLDGTKELIGRDVLPLKENEFFFVLSQPEGGMEPVTVGNQADGTFVFPPLVFEKAGEYVYRIIEQQPANPVGGVVYDAMVYTVTITVTQETDGTLSAAAVYIKQADGVTEDAETIAFSNTYTAAPANLSLTARKTLEGQELTAEQFTFVLKDADGAVKQTVMNAEDGTILFDDLVFEGVGTYVFTISEVTPEPPLGGVQYDGTEYTVTVTVEDKGDGTLSAVAAYEKQTDGVTEEAQALAFSNVYTVEPISLPLTATKTLEGQDLTGGQFDFVLKDTEGKVLQTAANDAEGQVAFEALVFEAEGSYTFTVAEQQPNAPVEGMTYDDTLYTVTVEVTDTGKGTLAMEVKYLRDDQPVEAMVFENRFVPPTPTPAPTPTLKPTPAPTPEAPAYDTLRVPLRAHKTLRNGKLTSGQFTFVLKDAAGTVLAEVTNNADGTITFPDRTFSRVVSKHLYTIEERQDNQAGIDYDTAVFTVKVTTRAVNGQLQASMDVLRDGTPHTGDITFVNTRHVPKTGDDRLMNILLLAALSAALGGTAFLVGRYAKRRHQ